MRHMRYARDHDEIVYKRMSVHYSIVLLHELTHALSRVEEGGDSPMCLRNMAPHYDIGEMTEIKLLNGIVGLSIHDIIFSRSTDVSRGIGAIVLSWSILRNDKRIRIPDTLMLKVFDTCDIELFRENAVFAEYREHDGYHVYAKAPHETQPQLHPVDTYVAPEGYTVYPYICGIAAERELKKSVL